eukprot:CAMPEP_0114985404 /NCGR_PEP_ID=MMETSP0216-20121206/7837_1 /TAXON_ID=223996 /ORGANISM="Protocruzia adherens, Strain Boccale" /LENGTH=194 /DNA_ID=CAMNT_0002347695 /DNA_START=76 /DNA_END=660 /DNA_ORIENTATION=-
MAAYHLLLFVFSLCWLHQLGYASSWSVPPTTPYDQIGRFGHSSIFLPYNNTFVHFGGFSYTDSTDPESTHGLKNDLWVYDMKERDWHEIQSPSHRVPAARAFHNAFYNNQTNTMTIFGGVINVDNRDREAKFYSIFQHSCGSADVWTLELSTFEWTPIVENDVECDSQSSAQKLAIHPIIYLLSMIFVSILTLI